MKNESAFVLDTHSFVWFLEADKKLSENAKQCMSNSQNTIYIPILVLVEIDHLFKKGRIKYNSEDILSNISDFKNWIVVDFTRELLAYIPYELDIHDGIICSFAVKNKIAVISKDSKMHKCKEVDTIW